MTLAVEHDKIWYGHGAPESERRMISAQTDLRVLLNRIFHCVIERILLGE